MFCVKNPRSQPVLLPRKPSVPGASARAKAGNLALRALLLPALLAGGCSTFNRDWRAAAQQPAPSAAITGRWEGRWRSEVNGHSGKLRCLVSQQDDTHYRADFRATYQHVLHFSYSVPLAVEPGPWDYRFSGQENLGKLAGGIYRYEGRAAPTNFFSTYRSQYDHGTFELHRPG
jgi:hypothetical protein